MNRGAGDVGGHSAVAAIAPFGDVLKDILDRPLWSDSEAELGDLLAMVCQLESQLAAVKLHAVAAAHGRDVAKRVGAASTQSWLRHTLKFTPAEAKKQTALAVALDRNLDMTRRALAEGAISVGHAQVIARTIEELPDEVGRAGGQLAAGDAAGPAAGVRVREAAEARLVQWAGQFDPAQLTRLGKRILEVVDPDAADADEARRLAEEDRRARLRREVRFTDDGHGTVWLRGRLDVESAAVVRRALDPLAKPRPSDAGLADARTPGARTADALVETCRRALAAGDLPVQRGETPQLVVTVDFDKLRDGLAAATLDTGERITPATARRLACDAHLIPAVLGSDSVPLDLGRMTRLFTPAQRRALALRDAGCAFPGCDRHPHWCHAHHIRHWVDGGTSDLANGVLLCGHHHRVIHKGEWQVRMADDGRPEFIPPLLIDPHRQPLRNHMRCRNHTTEGKRSPA